MMNNWIYGVIEMIFETEKEIIDADIKVIQLEITSNCNLKCKHCRGKESRKIKEDMQFERIKEIVEFALNNSDGHGLSVVLSGGEPLLHHELEKILVYCAEKNIRTEITTNGTLINNEICELLRINKVAGVSVSLDSYIDNKHDAFRGVRGAYKNTINGIQLLVKYGITTNIRTTISRSNYREAEYIVKLAKNLGVNSVSIGPIMPVGNARTIRNDMFEKPDEFEDFITFCYSLKEKYKQNMEVLVHECLASLYEIKENKYYYSKDMIIDGCSAGISSFNVLINGDITPCSMFHKRILNIYQSENWQKDYENSNIVRNILERNYYGKCGTCNLKEYCGGCRVRAEYYNGTYLGSDPLCYLK